MSLGRRAFNWLVEYILQLVTPDKRDLLRQHLDKQPSYACLLPEGRKDKIFKVELIELAFRLVMSDVYPFAKALDISDQILAKYRPAFRPNILEQGTIKMLHAMNSKDRFKISKALEQAGYPEEARAVYYGFEISLGDIIEIEKRVDMTQLAKELGVPKDETNSASPGSEVSCSECQKSILIRWKDTVHPSTFNHRSVLADALFSMGEEQMALDLLSGEYRKRVMSNSLSALLASTMKEEQYSKLCKVLGQKGGKGKNFEGVITAWASENQKQSLSDGAQLNQSLSLGVQLEQSVISYVTQFFFYPGEESRQLSNQLLEAGFYDFAHEIMAGARQDEEETKAVHETQESGNEDY